MTSHSCNGTRGPPLPVGFPETQASQYSQSMANLGAYPPDPATEVGWLRIAIKDAEGVPSVPPTIPQTAEYLYISDASLQTSIDLYPGDRLAQKADALTSMGQDLIMQAQLIQVDDIKIDTRQRGELFLQMAAAAREEAAKNGTGSVSGAFSVFPTNTGDASNWDARRPEGTPYPM